MTSIEDRTASRGRTSLSLTVDEGELAHLIMWIAIVRPALCSPALRRVLTADSHIRDEYV
ncbi:MAG: hypothetical protein ABIP45_00470 [Knoellia sp.]